MNPPNRRRICIFTSTRADYGLLYWLINDLRSRQDAEVQLLVTGSHLSPQFGDTWKMIAADGVPIAARVEMLVDGDSGSAMAASLGLGVVRYADAMASLSPDILVLLGDRYEVLAAASAALCLRIPVAHLHGGETTEGAMDDAVRHAVTAMAHLHFAAAVSYAQKIHAMGVPADRVFTVGAPGIDNLTRLDLPSREELERDLGIHLGDHALLVTYHPATRGALPPEEALEEVLAALDRFSDHPIIITKANADPGSRRINARIEAWAASHPGRVVAVASLGQRRYLAALGIVAAVVGNSSSGIIEAPAAGRPVVNIGDRQKGRLRARSIIDCPEQREAIADAIQYALSADMKRLAARCETPYGHGGVAARIAELLATVPLDGLGTTPLHQGERR